MSKSVHCNSPPGLRMVPPPIIDDSDSEDEYQNDTNDTNDTYDIYLKKLSKKQIIEKLKQMEHEKNFWKEAFDRCLNVYRDSGNVIKAKQFEQWMECGGKDEEDSDHKMDN